MQNSRFESGSGDRLRQACRLIERLDTRRNLPTGAVVLLFFFSAGVGVYAFFLMLDRVLWQGIDELVASLILAISWILIFPVWLLTFLFVMCLLQSVGITDLRTEARNRLSGLALEPDDLREIRRVLGSRTWRHKRLFLAVVAELISNDG